MEFHVSRLSRDKYNFDHLLFSTNGNVIFANFHAARQFAEKINALRTNQNDPKSYVAPGQINALGLIDEIFHIVMAEFYHEFGKQIRHNLFLDLFARLGEERLNFALKEFNEIFPPIAVYQGKTNVEDYLNSNTNGISNREITLEEILMLWLTNANPATEPYSELFNDSELESKTAYPQIIDGIQVFFKKQPVFGPEGTDLVTMLRTPALVVPQSLSGQLEYIKEHWSKYLGKYLYKLLGSLDVIKEEQKIFFRGPGPTIVPDYIADLGVNSELERFSPDSDWMPKVIMMAKNSFVWLNQLSRQYQRSIERLDQIPDETLDELARWGFTGLWLIGLWERSEASKVIKQMCGNPDAVSSAYSLSHYRIAERLGGKEAYENLSYRAGLRGIRLASDMVPNHMGIDSEWVIDHPDWFISSATSPFPSYSFNGPDLSKNSRISINLEDHYYTRSDASVVFKRYDHETGKELFVYHGNDGTSMPWNDTAQLNYLNPEVREAVIQTILSVARQFPIIRFDAAMTLTKKHYQRLWFPIPGTGGDIPSRADYALSREAFDEAMPEEFWREVVERVAKEVPDTLLLAEAFWLMEGYFVRSLGMHRVYNSAFMNMLRNEENEKYRKLIKNTLVYDPQILKRYVNFMNNPDEKTAVEQYGKGDKYFGICALMSTMPGLPMFGHGQIEGYAEKYGMEYYRPYWDESPDPYLIRRHETDIFPILHRRRIFADVENFVLFDFYTESGVIDEDVYAYANSNQNEVALVVFHNQYSSTSGWVKTSTPVLVKFSNNSRLLTKDIADALRLGSNDDDYVTFRDYVSKLEYIRSVREIREIGMFFALDAYSHHVFLDFAVVRGSDYAKLFSYLNGRGVPNLENVKSELLLSPVLYPLRKIINSENIINLSRLGKESDELGKFQTLLLQNDNWLAETAASANLVLNLDDSDRENSEDSLIANLKHIFNVQSYESALGLKNIHMIKSFSDELIGGLTTDPKREFILMLWALLSNLFGPNYRQDCLEKSRMILELKPVTSLVIETLMQLGFGDYEAYKSALALKWMLNKTNWLSELTTIKISDLFKSWLLDEKFSEFIEVNEYNNLLWFNKEKFEEMLWYMRICSIIQFGSKELTSTSELVEAILSSEKVFDAYQRALDNSDYKLDRFISQLDD